MNNYDFMVMHTSMIIARALSLPVDVVYNYITSTEFRTNTPPVFMTMIDSSAKPIRSVGDYCLRVLAKYQGLYADGQLVQHRMTTLKAVPEIPGVMEVAEHLPLQRNYEFADLTFDIMASFGTWRDLNRHSLVSQWEWPLVPNLGYAVPDDFDMLSDILKEQYQTLFAMSTQLWQEVKKRQGTFLAQYAALFMWYQRRWVRANVREWSYIMELRSLRGGHHEYRRIAQLIHKRITSLWPITRHILRIDNNDYRLGPILIKNPTIPIQKTEEDDQDS